MRSIVEGDAEEEDEDEFDELVFPRSSSFLPTEKGAALYETPMEVSSTEVAPAVLAELGADVPLETSGVERVVASESEGRVSSGRDGDVSHPPVVVSLEEEGANATAEGVDPSSMKIWTSRMTMRVPPPRVKRIVRTRVVRSVRRVRVYKMEGWHRFTRVGMLRLVTTSVPSTNMVTPPSLAGPTPLSRTSDPDLLLVDILSEDFDPLHFLNLSYTPAVRERRDFVAAGMRSMRDVAKDALRNALESARNVTFCFARLRVYGEMFPNFLKLKL